MARILATNSMLGLFLPGPRNFLEQNMCTSKCKFEIKSHASNSHIPRDHDGDEADNESHDGENLEYKDPLADAHEQRHVTREGHEEQEVGHDEEAVEEAEGASQRQTREIGPRVTCFSTLKPSHGNIVLLPADQKVD